MDSAPREHIDVTLAAELSVIKPGDTVLVHTTRPLSQHQAQQIRDHLMERLPNVDVCVITGVGGIDVYRPGATDLPAPTG